MASCAVHPSSSGAQVGDADIQLQEELIAGLAALNR